MEKKLFDRLMESANQALEHAEGKRKDLRTTVLPKPPEALTAKQIAAIRSRQKLSQAVFAKHLNVTTKAVQMWEQDLRKPSGAALKLLAIAAQNPDAIFK